VIRFLLAVGLVAVVVVVAINVAAIVATVPNPGFEDR
jgi:hypothetical protein